MRASDRTARFAEFVQLMDELLRRSETTHEGRYYVARAVRMHPGCTQRPRVPFAVAATGPVGMRLAARMAQVWVTVGVAGNFEPSRFDRMQGVLREQVDRLEQACTAEGRQPSTLRRMIVAGTQVGGVLDSRDSFVEARGLFTELGFTDMTVFWPREEFPFAGRERVLEDIAPDLHLVSNDPELTP
jgi:alkanesulfonate monooxygenase SsuD/methylene tetrahydromethanopterin reductase-like flavin-dependent oxidoreductase (luciferase family)